MYWLHAHEQVCINIYTGYSALYRRPHSRLSDLDNAEPFSDAQASYTRKRFPNKNSDFLRKKARIFLTFYSSDVCSSGLPVSPGSRATWDAQLLKIPAVSPSVINCCVIKVEYYVKVNERLKKTTSEKLASNQFQCPGTFLLWQIFTTDFLRRSDTFYLRV